jgi:hypothetical protein
MGSIFIGLIGIVCSFFLVKYREQIGNMLGEPEWATKVGGIYNVVLIVAIFFFFWSLATMTGTSAILFAPIVNLIPGGG